MLKKSTTDLLGKLSLINSKQIISYPRTVIIAGKSMQAYIDMDKIGEEEFNEISFYDINQFIQVAGVLGEDPEIVNEDGVLTISKGTQKIKYITANTDILEDECRGIPDLVDRIRTNTNLTTFNLDSEMLDKIKKIAITLKDLNILNIKTEGNIATLTTTSPEKSSNNFSFTVPCKSIEDIDINLNIDMLSKIPQSSYKLSVYRGKSGGLLCLFDSYDIEGLSITLGVKS